MALNVVMQLAGHSSLAVTTRYASHLPGGATAAAIAALEASVPATAPAAPAAPVSVAG